MFQLNREVIQNIVDTTEELWKKPEFNLEYKKALLDMNLAASKLNILLLKDELNTTNTQIP